MRAPVLSRAAPEPVFDFAFSVDEFRTIASILYADAGIALAEHKMPLVYGRLVKRLRALGLESFKHYCALIDSRAGVDERQAMMAALTTNVTKFMREPHHFDRLRSVILPPLVDKIRQGLRVRIWSAACSSGQEPYSIALTLLRVMPDIGEFDVRILASDIDPNMIAAGRAGAYTEDEISAVSKADQGRWFTLEADQGGGRRWVAGDAMRQLVAFRQLNLIGPWPMTGRFDVIFCRNVVIYFDQETQARIWDRFASVLHPGGLLCIGHSERLCGPATQHFQSAGPTMFIRREDH